MPTDTNTYSYVNNILKKIFGSFSKELETRYGEEVTHHIVTSVMDEVEEYLKELRGNTETKG